MIELNLSAMNLALKKVNLLQSGKIILVDEENHIVYHPEKRPGLLLYESWMDSGPAKPYFLFQKNEGEPFLYLKSSIDSVGWTLYGVIPYEEVLDKIIHIRYKFYIFLILMVLAIGIVALSIKRVFVIPVLKLQQLMRRVQAGEFYVRANYNRKDEIGDLADSFNQMVTQIEELIQKVYQVKLNESRALLYQKQAELKALQAHITPHFLYNTLHSISWFANRRGVREIQVVIDSLSSILRYSLENSPKMVRLIDEFEYLKLYMERVEIFAFKQDDQVILEVRDNGCGVAQEVLEDIHERMKASAEGSVDHAGQEEPAGMGLINVHSRLQLWFGKEYGLQLLCEKGGGTNIQLRVPLSFDHEKFDAAAG